MITVVDLGCRTYGDDNSILPLLRRYMPDLFYGFDPLLPKPFIGRILKLSPKAAWTHDGKAALGIGAPSLLDATMLMDKTGRGEWDSRKMVPCFDFAAWLEEHGPAVVKMNIEGAEFPLLEHLIQNESHGLMLELVIAWHDDRLGGAFHERRERIEQALTCPVVQWTLGF